MAKRNFLSKTDYFARHLRNFLPYLTIGKLANLLRNEMELRLGIAEPKSFPVYIKVDPTPRCHLRCPSCQQSEPAFKGKFDRSMDLTVEHLRAIVEPLSKTLLGISLSFTGEPFSNKRLIDCIEYIHSKRIAVSLPTNLSITFKEGDIEKLATSGLDSLLVSLDGASPDTYAQFRVGGDFDLVLRNVRELASARRRLGVSRPVLVWKFIVFEHNRHEVPLVRERYRDLGFDSYEINENYHSADLISATESANRSLVDQRKPCYWPWHSLIVRWDGEVTPCCKSERDFALGNAFRQEIVSIWRGQAYRKLRMGFAKEAYGSQMNPICKQCLGIISEADLPRDKFPTLLRRRETLR